MAIYTLLLIPADAAGGALAISGYADNTEADAAGTAAIADAFFDRYLVIPAPTVKNYLSVFQPGGGSGGGSGGQSSADSR